VRAPFVTPLVLLLLCASAARAQDAAAVAQRIQLAQRALDDWQIVEAAQIAEELARALPDVPPVQAVVGAVKFHQGDYAGAVRLLERAAEGGEAPPLLELARSTYEETKGFVSKESAHFMVRTSPGKDELLADIALASLEQAYGFVTEAFDYRPAYKIPVDIVHDPKGLASVSTLTVKEIETSGTIALCKFNRLMVTSPKALARGYGWLDTLAHELIHLVISEKSRNTVPIWLHEGLAKYSESLWRDGVPGLALHPASENLLAQAVKKNDLVTFEQMHPSMAKLPSQEKTALAFAEVFTVIEFLHASSHKETKGKKGYAVTNRLLDELAQGKAMDRALKASVGMDLKGMQTAWIRYLKKRPFKRTPGAVARRLDFVKNARGEGRGVDELEAEAALEETKSREGRRFVRLGNLLRQRGRLRASTMEYEKALPHVGKRSPALNNRLAGLYLELGDMKAAKESLEKSLRVFPDDPQTRVLLGRVAVREEQWTVAKGHYERATWENPFHPEVWAGLLRIGEATGDEALQQRAKGNLQLLAGHARKHAAADAPGNLKDDEPFGTLSLESQPWGEVWVDGHALGMTTPLVDYRLRPGSHRVRVEDRASGKMVSREVLIEDGKAARLSFSLAPLPPEERERLLSLERPRAVPKPPAASTKPDDERETPLWLER
jgi:tetratricopeptide (TPR) repeat protein